MEAALADLAAARTTLGEPDPTVEGWQDTAARIRALGAQSAALERTRVAARRALSIPGDDTFTALVEADRLALGAAPDAAAEAPIVDRLRRALPLLTPPLSTTLRADLYAAEARALRSEEASLKAQQADIAAALASIDVADLTDGVPVYEGRHQRAVAQRKALEGADPIAPEANAPTQLIDQRARIRMLRKEVAKLQEDLALRRLTRAQRLAELGLTEKSLTKADVTAAEARAADAAQKALDARNGAQRADRLVAEALSAALDAGVRQVQDEQARQQKVEGQLSGFEAALSEAQVAREDALALPPLDSTRRSQLEQAWRQSDDLVGRLRGAVMSRANGCKAVISFDKKLMAGLPTVASDVRTQVTPDLIGQLDVELAAVADRSDGRRRGCRAEVAAVMAVLAQAKEARRRIEAAAPQVVARDTDSQLSELWDELRAIPVRLEGGFWKLVHIDPRAMSIEDQIGWLVDLALGSVELLAVWVAWVVVRRFIPRITAAFVAWLADARRARFAGRFGVLARLGVPGDPKRLGGPLEPALRELVDSAAGFVTFLLMCDVAPALALPVLIWTGAQLVALAPHAVGLALGLPGDGRPSLRQVTAEVRDLAQDTARVATIWWAALQVIDFVALGLLDADRLSDLAHSAMLLAGVLAALKLLSGWWGPVRAVLTTHEQNRVTQALTREVHSALLRAPMAAAGLVVLLERALVQLATRLIETRAGLAWLGAALARQRLRDSDQAPDLAPLPAALERALLGPHHPELTFPHELAALQAAYADWRVEQRRGITAVIGSHGSGKSHLIAQFTSGLPADTAVRVLPPPKRCHDVDQALAWFADALDIPLHETPTPSSAAAVISAALLELPPMVLVIDDTQRFFLRAVGGFRALRRMLGLMHATSERHFWLCSFHGPSWWFLEGVSQAVNLSVVRTRVSMPALDPARLAAWLEARLAHAGRSMRFDALVQDGVVDLPRAIDRARTAYWLLLADESGGNPRVALGYWVSSLRAGDADDEVKVALFSAPVADTLMGVGDRELFVLTALSIHGQLDIEDFAETLNMAPGICRATCRQLESLGVLLSDRSGQSFHLNEPWQPVVNKVLRQKQFLHGK